MASMTFRNIPEDVKRRFRLNAAAQGRSMEEHGRRLINASVANDEGASRKSMFDILYDASRPGLDLPIPPRSRARIPTFDDE
jgi:plasmid stability protein